MIAALVGAGIWAVAVSCGLSLLLCGLVSLMLRVRTLEATVRQTLWTVALWTTALMPFMALGVGVLRAEHATSNTLVIRSTAQPGAADRFADTDSQLSHQRSSGSQRSRTTVSSMWQPQLEPNVALALLALWLCGAAAGLAGLVQGLVRVRGLKRRSSPLDSRLAAELPWLTGHGAREREIYLRLSYETETPIAIGFRRPVILIPTELATHGGLAAIEGLIIHEHAHLRRRDDWTNLAQRVIERVCWFNPLVWVLGRRIALEREIAADDAVVAATGRAHEYAQSLWQIAREMRMAEHTVVAPGAFSTRKHLSVRIEALLERRSVPAPWRAVASCSVILMAIGCGVAAAATAPRLVLPVGGTMIVFDDARAGHPPPTARRMRRAAASQRRAIVAPRDVAVVARIAATPQAAAAAEPAEPAEPAVPAQPAVPALPIKRPESPAGPLDCPGCSNSAGTSSSDLSGADLRQVDWRGRTMRWVNLSGADLAGARLDGTHFIESNLSGANLTGASLRDALFTSTSIDGATFRHSLTTGLRVIGVSFSGTDLHDLDVRALVAACTGCDFSGADLRSSDLHGLRLSGLNFSGSDLRGVDFSGARLVGVNFDGADLAGARFRDARALGCSFEGANVSRAALHGAVLSPPLADESIR